MDGRGPYGLACMNCFRSKCKCVLRPEGDGCVRCHRLGKHCSPSDSVRRRSAQRAQSSAARIAHLEGKLDGIVSLLESVAQQPAAGAPVASTAASPPPPPPLPPLPPLQPLQPQRQQLQPQPPPFDPTSTHDASAQEAEAALALFRHRMLPFCPFLDFPPALTAHQLRQSRPFLFQAILAVTTHSMQEKRARAKEIKTFVSQRMVVENQSNIDLLLGLLTYVAWSHDQVLHRASTLSRLIQLAMSIILDLRLAKPMPRDAHMLTTVGVNNGSWGEPGDDPEHSLERHRAVLGCFLLSSIVSTYFAQVDPLRWTPQMNEYLRRVETNTACPTDPVLACQVRLQLLANRSTQLRDQQEAEDGQPAPLPIVFCTNVMQSQLHKLKDSLTPELRTQDFLIAHWHYVELSIQETAYLSHPEAQTSTTGASIGSGPGWERLDCLWRTLQATQAWLEAFFRIPPAGYPGLPILTLAQLSRALVTLYHLSTRTDPGWDRRAVGRMVDIFRVLDRVDEHMSQAGLAREGLGMAVPAPDDDFWPQLGGLAQLVRAWLRATMGSSSEKLSSGPQEPSLQPQVTGAMPPPLTSAVNANISINDILMGNIDPMMMHSMDFGSDPWMDSMGW